MKLFLKTYLLFSILISTSFSNLLIANVNVGNNHQTICTYDEIKILLPNGKLTDESDFHDECDLCINCFLDFS